MVLRRGGISEEITFGEDGGGCICRYMINLYFEVAVDSFYFWTMFWLQRTKFSTAVHTCTVHVLTGSTYVPVRARTGTSKY
eukprot:SAG31_NODE_1412_length_8463_cov_6.657102_6_plen_81_part_00